MLGYLRSVNSSRLAPSHTSARTLPPRGGVVARMQMSPAALQEALKDPATREAIQKAMQDPQFMERMKQMQAAMANPEMQRQMAQMQAVSQNPQLQERMKLLKDDPEFADVFADIQKNGMGALMKYYNDPKFLAKLSGKISDVVPEVAATATGSPAAPAPPEINNILDAAKYGDLEAVEDFVAIGKDVNMKDEEARTALHYACGTGNSEIARLLLESGADLEAADSKGNTPLHYAAGYGRPDTTRLLLDAGANRSAKNGSGKTATELVTLAPANPINQDFEVFSKLKQ